MITSSLPSARRRPWSFRIIGPALFIVGMASTMLPAAAAPGGGDGLAGLFAPGPALRAPEFPPGVTWLNSPPLTLKQLRGKVVLVDFWEYTCVNCIRTFPYLLEWDRRYRSKGLV